MTSHLSVAVVIALQFLPATLLADVELGNDGFQDGQAAGFQGGFVEGEIGAVRIVVPADVPRPVYLKRVRYLFGGNTEPATFTLKVWDDSEGTTAPGAEIWSGDFMATGSNSAIQEADLREHGIMLPGDFRIGIEFQHMGYPSIARDDDGNFTPSRNFIYAKIGSNFQWFDAPLLGVQGDWIIRAIVATPGPDGGIDTPSSSSAQQGSSSTTASSAAPASSSSTGTAASGSCQVNSDCAVGSHCDAMTSRCTFECREDGDCATGKQCNSLGSCVEAVDQNPDDGTGADGCNCGTTGAPSSSLGWVALGVAVWVARRRRAA